MRKVAVIGGGYAGCAAAVELSRLGVAVQLFEAGPELGGRARRVRLPDDVLLDNGQHLFIGAYRELLRLTAEVGLEERDLFHRVPLDLDLPGEFRMRCPRMPAPWHTVLGLLSATGLSWQERWAATRLMVQARLTGYRLERDLSVAEWLDQHRQPARLIRLLWEPLTLSALNTPLVQASAQVLLNVLRDSLASSRAASDFLIAKVDLSACFPDAAATYLQRHGGKALTGHAVRQLEQAGSGWLVDAMRFDGVVLALAPHRVAGMASALPSLAQHLAPLADWSYQPIYTVYLRYPPGTRLPRPMLGFVGQTSQWVFDRGALLGEEGMLAVVISAEGPHCSWAQPQLVEVVQRELATAFPALPPAIWHKVIAEKRATFACTPDLRRPSNASPYPTLWLAGDYTAGDYPATIEGALRSGVAAARGLATKFASISA